MSENASAQDRDALVEKHTEFAGKLARKIHTDIGGAVDYDELLAYALSGLVEAAGRYDASRGAAFTTFSYYRIRGAVYDGLRKLGWLNRAEYGRFQAGANALLENKADRESQSNPAGAEALADVADTLAQVATIFVTSLDAEHAAEAADTDQPSADDQLHQRRTHAAVREALPKLDEKERQLIEMYYFGSMTLQAVGDKLGLSKSWTSRLHARAVKNLNNILTELGDW